jgi:hypothetical protein
MCCEQSRDECCVVQGRNESECHGDLGFQPAFWTKEEKITRLETCLADLNKKAKLFEERIACLKKEA